MKHVYRNINALIFGLTLLIMVEPSSTASPLLALLPSNFQTDSSETEKKAVDAFDKRVRTYVNQREALERTMPKLSKDATPEQIEAHKTGLQERVRSARAAAKQGQLFTPDISNIIRAIVRKEVKGIDRVELRQTVFEAETKGVKLRVNFPYPESQEFVEMPPTLLLRLPQLPKQVRYRFVGRNLLLVDRENGLILDYMTNALP